MVAIAGELVLLEEEEGVRGKIEEREDRKEGDN